jgi:hypothetical protein
VYKSRKKGNIKEKKGKSHLCATPTTTTARRETAADRTRFRDTALNEYLFVHSLYALITHQSVDL